MHWTDSFYSVSGLSQAGRLGGAFAPHVFGRSVNPISTRGAHYPHPVLHSPPDFQTLRRPWHGWLTCEPAPICTLNLVQNGKTNPLLESFGESPKACVTHSSHPLANFKWKENPDLPSVCSNYWPPNVALSLCFNHLVLSTFRQCRSAIPPRSAKPIASIHHTVQYP